MRLSHSELEVSLVAWCEVCGKVGHSSAGAGTARAGAGSLADEARHPLHEHVIHVDIRCSLVNANVL